MAPVASPGSLLAHAATRSGCFRRRRGGIDRLAYPGLAARCTVWLRRPVAKSAAIPARSARSITLDEYPRCVVSRARRSHLSAGPRQVLESQITTTRFLSSSKRGAKAAPMVASHWDRCVLRRGLRPAGGIGHEAGFTAWQGRTHPGKTLGRPIET